jgi:phosphatidylserine/phosphatidylglycerophosphate/cardiolipin synthase-like enzyme
MKSYKKYRFSWRDKNSFRLLVDGNRFYPSMLHSIDSANLYIYLEIYLFESGNTASRFIDCLVKAANRGVAVYLLLDDYGARGLLPKDKRRLTDNGIRLSLYNPFHYGHFRRNLFRDHRKILVVDGKVAFTGGAGITDEFDPEQLPRLYWHETMIEIHGENIKDWETVFIENWNLWSKEKLQLTENTSIHDTETLTYNQAGRVVLSRATPHSEIVRSFIKHIRNAEQHVWLVTAYFVPSWKLRRALRHTARRGVDVRLMLPGPHTDHEWVRHMGRRYYERLLRSGIRIFEYQPRFLHAKILLCDHWVSTGSSNVDRWNFIWNLEANQEVDDSEFTRQVMKQLESDFSDCREIDYEQWRQRPRSRRIREWFWGKVFRLLSWFSTRRK